jgi:hypothetical protein
MAATPVAASTAAVVRATGRAVTSRADLLARWQWLALAAVFAVLYEALHILEAHHQLSPTDVSGLSGPLIAAMSGCVAYSGVGQRLTAVLQNQSTAAATVEQVAEATNGALDARIVAGALQAFQLHTASQTGQAVDIPVDSSKPGA